VLYPPRRTRPGHEYAYSFPGELISSLRQLPGQGRNPYSSRDVIAGQRNSAIKSILPTMLTFSASRSPAGIQYSRMIWPPTWWTSQRSRKDRRTLNAHKDSVDRAASVLMADAAERARVRRFVQVSSMAGQPPQAGSGEVWAAYITAKTAAEADLRARDLDWTILRPGGSPRLLRPAGSGSRPAGTVPRVGVAAVIAALLDEPGTRHQTLELVGGDSPVDAAAPSIS
jgi:hypothetical protein